MTTETTEDPLRGVPGRGAKVAAFLREFGIGDAAVTEIACHPKVTVPVCKRAACGLGEEWNNPAGLVSALRSDIKYFNALEAIRKANLADMAPQPNAHLTVVKGPVDDGCLQILRDWIGAGRGEMVVAWRKRMARIDAAAEARRKRNMEMRGIACEGCAGLSIHHDCGLEWDEESGEYRQGDAK